MWAIMASDLVRPHAEPSGVSMGQMRPHAVGWSCRGSGFFVSRATGVDNFRRSEMVVDTVIRPSCWATPFCAVLPFVDRIPQLPVAAVTKGL